MDRTLRWLGTCASLALLAGCATTSDSPDPAPRLNSGSSTAVNMAEHVQFEPLPLATVDAVEDLSPPESGPTTSELVAKATEAFEAANQAIEAGDEESAYQNYTIMLETLLEADLDPETFYKLRDQFSGILSRSFEIARHYERSQDDGGLARESLADFGVDDTQPLHARVQAEIDAIQRVYPKSFQAGLDRSYRYLPYIRAEFAKAGLPEDLVWLAMVESQFTPRIDSHAGAGGMWQFMRSTGRRYGLRSDWYLDERYDWKKATQAAVQYLSELYTMFDGNWPLAVSAYNMGEAGLEGAIASAGGERDLWTLIETPPASRRIRLETKRFYAKFLASAIVANNPEQYGFEARPQDAEVTDYITVDGSYSLADIEKEIGASQGSLARLNPHFIQGYTPPARTSYLSVPSDQRERVASAIGSMPELRLGTHTVQRGETLSVIAATYKVSVAELQQTNHIKSPKSLQVGQKLVIPGFADSSAAPAAVAVAVEPGATAYTVRTGDSLSTIATAHRVSVKDLQRWNNLGSRTGIRAGDRLVVASSAANVATSTSASGSSTETVYHTVKKGEYPGKIAKSYGVSLNDLLNWNGLSNRSTIRVGQRLKVVVPKKSGTQSVAAAVIDGPVTSQSRTHVVTRGESASVIAQKHGVSTTDLLKWNQLDTTSVLKEGDQLVVGDPATNNPAI